MAVHNGAAMLPAKIDHLLSLEPTLIREIVIVSDGSTDASNQILQSALDPRLRILVLPEQVGKSAAVNRGVELATGDILLFVDIRPVIEPGALTSLLANFADPKVGCVAGELLIAQNGNDATTAAVSGLYWRYEQYMRNCEAAFDSPVGVYGGFYAIRRACAVPAPAGLILDDMFQPLAIIRQGYRSVLDREALVTDRWPAQATDEFARKVRTLAGNFQLIQVAPWILGPSNRVLFQLVSHKLLRLAVPYFFALMLLSAAILGIHSLTYALITLALLAFLTMAAIATRYPIPVVQRVAAPLGALLVLNAAAVVGLYKFLFTRGPLWRIWSPTKSPTQP
jgi:glycosyltransferase involved in cell wall biosynthesis